MKKIFSVQFLMFLILAVFLMTNTASAADNEPAAVLGAKTYKNTLVKVKIAGSDPVDYDWYYYDQNGKKLVNSWKKIKTYKYYFGKQGKAYKAAKDAYFKYNVSIRKIGAYRYGFDVNGRMVTGLWVSAGFSSNYLYYFGSNGKYSASITSALRKAAKQGTASAKLKTLLKKYAGNPKKTYKAQACTLYKGVAPKYATVMQYQRFEVQLFAMPDGSEIVYMVVGALR